MRGQQVFYPVGWDDNGLPTERRAQNYYGVRADPSLPYDPDLKVTPSDKPVRPADQVPVSRRNFVELCRELTAVDEAAYAIAWRRLGLSVDWDISYRTIDDRAQAISQRVFLRDLARADAYQAEGPSLWDVTFGTAVAQAEIEDRVVDGAYARLAFLAQGSAEVIVATTRPELLPACVALVAHPDDPRYAALFGTTATTPLFGVEVPVLAHRLADPDKGTGIAMVCTFGDTTDVTWWRDLHLDTRPVIGRDGRLLPSAPSGISTNAGLDAYAQLAGLRARAARRRIVELLSEAGALRGEPEPIQHAVKFYENGSEPLEIVTTRQWYIRNGARDPELRARLLDRGRELDWHPAHMRSRYENWVDGLSGDWLVSRQRYSGVPIPVWYPVDDSGQPDRRRPIVPPDAALPVDPAAEVPAGYRADQRDRPGGFTADPDVMDTWATSSLTPLIAAGWSTPDDILARVFPMDLRPQAHEIIRTWLFYTVLRAEQGWSSPAGRDGAWTEEREATKERTSDEGRRRLEGGRGGGWGPRRGAHEGEGVLPWRHAAISGWIVDPDRKKMSKSKGNALTPADMLENYGTDAVRYWAASARLGVDTVFDPAQLKIGRRLAVKILNASRFVLGIGDSGLSGDGPVTEPIDRALLRGLAAVTTQCTDAFEAYDHALALEHAERFFWFFCDDYLELVKPRAYGERGPAAAASAMATLRLALSAMLRLLAPFVPFVTEEVWSWWQEGSIHVAPWPEPDGFLALADALAADGAASPDGTAVLDAAAAAIGAVRRAKSQAQLPMKAPVSQLILTAPQDQLDALAAAASDVSAAGRVAEIRLHALPGIEPVHEVLL
jgi:valyl-tRNA synthetase